MGAVKLLARTYFGNDFVFEFDFENLVERADSASPLATKPGLPPWYKHMTFPMTAEEIALVT